VKKREDNSVLAGMRIGGRADRVQNQRRRGRHTGSENGKIAVLCKDKPIDITCRTDRHADSGEEEHDGR
jgi:hypothetical protein